MGSTGGCQAVYTVYPAPNTTAENPPSCANVTFPAGAMDVEAGTSGGSFSQYGWVPQARIGLTVKTHLIISPCHLLVLRHLCYAQKWHSTLYLHGCAHVVAPNQHHFGEQGYYHLDK